MGSGVTAPEKNFYLAETAKFLFDAFNAHDLDAMLGFLADDCSRNMPEGPDEWG